MLLPEEVAIFHNTRYPVSSATAVHYATARHIPNENIVGFDMGTNWQAGYPTRATRDTFRATTLTAIRDWLALRPQIRMVVLSLSCPVFYGQDPEFPSPDAYTYYHRSSFCRAVGDCFRLLAMSADTRPIMPYYLNVGTPTVSFGGTRTAQLMRLYGDTPVYDWRDIDFWSSGYRTVMCGRLGYAQSKDSGDLSRDNQALAYRCIDDAVWFETHGDPWSAPTLFGMSTRAYLLEHGNVWLAANMAARKGLTNILTYDGSSSARVGSFWRDADWGYAEPVWTITNAAQWLTGHGPLTPFWGWVGTGMENIGSIWTPSVAFQRGAWMFEATSEDVSRYAIPQGACAAILPLLEPTVVGLPEISGLSCALLRGFSIEEATVMCCQQAPSAVTEVWGDPLYAPFKNQ